MYKSLLAVWFALVLVSMYFPFACTCSRKISPLATGWVEPSTNFPPHWIAFSTTSHRRRFPSFILCENFRKRCKCSYYFFLCGTKHWLRTRDGKELIFLLEFKVFFFPRSRRAVREMLKLDCAGSWKNLAVSSSTGKLLRWTHANRWKVPLSSLFLGKEGGKQTPASATDLLWISVLMEWRL